MRQIRHQLSWILLAGGLYFVSKGAYAVYPLILPPAVDSVALLESHAMKPTGGTVPPLGDGSPVFFADGSPSNRELGTFTDPFPNSLPEGSILARLEFPSLNATIPVVEGVTDSALRLGAGHFPGTPLPGALSNSVIAGHRDTYFRVLSRIQVGDRVLIDRGTQQVAYTVFQTLVVEPDNVSVLRPADGRILTLITCYPFQFIGSAPQRFIVKARAENAGLED